MLAITLDRPDTWTWHKTKGYHIIGAEFPGSPFSPATEPQISWRQRSRTGFASLDISCLRSVSSPEARGTTAQYRMAVRCCRVSVWRLSAPASSAAPARAICTYRNLRMCCAVAVPGHLCKRRPAPGVYARRRPFMASRQALARRTTSRSLHSHLVRTAAFESR